MTDKHRLATLLRIAGNQSKTLGLEGGESRPAEAETQCRGAYDHLLHMHALDGRHWQELQPHSWLCQLVGLEGRNGRVN